MMSNFEGVKSMPPSSETRVGELGGVNPTGFDFGGPGPGGIY